MKSTFNPQAALISIILPTYNEKGNIIPLMDCIKIEMAGCLYEIIVIDDNSPDKTGDMVNDYGDENVRVLMNDKKEGLARSILRGIEESKGGIIIIMDSDFNHQPQYLRFIIDELEDCDCVSASRFLKQELGGYSPRYFLTKIFNAFTRRVLSGKMTDYFYGFAGFRRRCLERCDLSRIFYGYGDYYMRLILHLEKSGRNIREFHAVNGTRLSGAGNKNFLGVFIQYFREVIKLSYQA